MLWCDSHTAPPVWCVPALSKWLVLTALKTSMSGLDNWLSEHTAVNREDPTLILRTPTKTRCGGMSLYPPGLQASLAKLLELYANEILLKNTNLKSR